MIIKKRKLNLQTWIGLADVIPRAGNKNLRGAKGAVVNILALANSVKSFDGIACKFLIKWGFDVLEISDIEPFKKRLSHFKVAKGLLALEKKLSKKNPVVWYKFHTYKKG